MGNSQSQQRQQEAKLSSLLAKWSSQEQCYLRDQYKRIGEDVAKGDGSIPTELFIQAIARLRPAYCSQNLTSSIGWYISQKDSAVTFQNFAEASVLLLAGAEEVAVEAAYAIFMQSKVSLETFVQWVVESAIPVWFEGSGLKQIPDTTVKEQAAAATRLARFLVHRTHNEQQREKQRRLDEENLWMGEQKHATVEDTWAEEVTATPSALDLSTFSLWIRNTPAFLVLFRLVAELIFFGHRSDTDIHKRRIERRTAPGIAHSTTKQPFSRLLTAYDYFMLTLFLPANTLSWSPSEQSQRRVSEDLQHRLVYSSRTDGTSWQVFVNRLAYQGATLTVIKAKNGCIFGAYADDVWRPVTNWYGNGSNFLYRLNVTGDDYLEMGAWNAKSINDHFQYLCWGKKSLPNGLAMGGQFDYCGLWLDSDFLHGHSRAGPLCSTYASPRLSKDENFELDEVEVWLVRPVQREDGDETEPQGGALSRTEDMEFLEMAGKKLYSRDLGPALHEEEEEEKESKDH
ncbi:hypothetical protein DFQ28_004212 [Apophysomyces sp. BC1034]|nr:hypothetical protein DFQ30_004194 [Apophysomyces sp. BC1015]KAG0178544.1 hypothetical protein DFQ29_003327 [Apophysomyces sp. BC1021]KAG0188870.1 hypothetical protein DFQ28_004212 [Apophysomyces sp. BC1034]